MMCLFRSRERILVAAALIGGLPFLFGQGCIPSGPGTSVLTVAVSGPASNQSVSAGSPVSVIYTVQGGTALDIRGFYDKDGVADSGDEVYFASGLPAGVNMTALWNTSGVPAGSYRVGIYASDGLTAQTVYAAGVVTVQQAFYVNVDSPATDVTSNPGGQITVRFGTSLTNFSYEVFYDMDGRPNTGDETMIRVGSSSGSGIVSATWNTTDVPPATYYVGVTVDEVGGSGRTASVYATGRVILVGGAGVYVLEPSTYLDVNAGTLVQIVFSAVAPEGVSATLDIFYDTDLTFAGDEPTIATGLRLDQNTVQWDTQGIAPGTYYIGAVMRFATMGTPISNYAPGRVTVDGGGSGGGGGGTNTISVTVPLADATIFQGDTYTIRWVTGTVPAGATVSLYRDTDIKQARTPDGNPVLIKAGLTPGAKQYAWATGTANGRFLIIAKLIGSDGTTIAQAVSPGRLTIRPPYFWVGEVGTPAMPGAILRGFNFQDLAGSSLAKVGDLDGDGVDDIVIVSQFGKPGLINPSGVGPGEAYLIFGNNGRRLTGSFDLNRTGSKPASSPTGLGGTTTATATDGLDQGVMFTGIALMPNSTVTTGITSVCTVPDSDAISSSVIGGGIIAPGDGGDELAFGIAKADSLSLASQGIRVGFEGLLENDGQFLRGGVVIVSSTNAMIRSVDPVTGRPAPSVSRAAVNRDGNRVIRLQEVGQATTMIYSAATCNSDITCASVPWFGQLFEDSNGDGKCDTYDPFWVKGFWQPTDPAPYTVNPALAPVYSWCPVFSPAFVTGMYTDENDIEPFGCRILGQAPEDGTPPDARYGTMVSAIRAPSGPQFLLASAPNMTAKTTYIPDLPGGDRVNSGVAYELILTNYWDPTDTDPVDVARPHQYIVRTAGYTPTHNVYTTGKARDLIERPVSIVGASANARISLVQAIPDFNGDGLMDIVIGSPNEGAGGQGAIYVLFRRPIEGEGNYFLEKMALDPSDPERLNGVLIRGEPNYHLGEAASGGGDFNKDGKPDLIIGIPNYYDPADATKKVVGAALIVFGGGDLVSPVGGFRITDLIASGRGALLVGANAGDLAGFNVASAGDVDGDRKDDLLIAAPGASPRLPDGTIGLDYNGDGKPDDLTNSGTPTNLTGAGIVYLVLGANDLLGTIQLSKIGTTDLRGVAFVGEAANDNLGGGVSALGLGARSQGLSSAGDVDKDGKTDILISAMLASPGGKTHAGEVYLIYGGFRP
jgi:hypothetical protein